MRVLGVDAVDALLLGGRGLRKDVACDGEGMRFVVGFASGVFALALVQAFRMSDSAWYDGTWGIAVALLGGVALVRSRGTTAGRPATGGTHSR